MANNSDTRLSRSASAYLADEFDFLWRTEKLPVACQFLHRNFELLPDPAPLRIVVSRFLFRQGRTEQAIDVLEKTISHYLNSGYFFRAVEAFVELRDIKEDTEKFAEIFFSIFGPESEHTRATRALPNFPEIDPVKIVRAESITSTDYDDFTEDKMLDSIYELVSDEKSLRDKPDYVPILPLISKWNQETFRQFLQFVNIEAFETMHIINDLDDGEIAWTVGPDTFVRDDHGHVIPLPSGSILGLDYYYRTSHEPYEIVGNHSVILRLPPMTLPILEATWNTMREDLRSLAFAALVEKRFVMAPLFDPIPLNSKAELLQNTELKIVERGNIIGVSNTENHLGSYTSPSPFFLVLAGNVVVEVLEEDEALGNSSPLSIEKKAPCVIGAFDFFIQNAPTMVFRATTHVVIAVLTAAKIQELVIAHGRIGDFLSELAAEMRDEFRDISN